MWKCHYVNEMYVNRILAKKAYCLAREDHQVFPVTQQTIYELKVKRCCSPTYATQSRKLLKKAFAAMMAVLWEM